MKLPNADIAIIPQEKLRDYLTSTTHPIGRFKAVFFQRLGYTDKNWQELDVDLREQHLKLEAVEEAPSTYGRKFIITGSLKGPAEYEAVVTSVWSYG
ncbi:MAG: DUF6883 domain-containing protein [Dehalococcoidia bacterium]